MDGKVINSLTLENLGSDTVKIFKAACKFSVSLNKVEIVSISEVELPSTPPSKGFNITLHATTEEIFSVGRFFERLDHLRYIELNRQSNKRKTQ